MAIISQYHSNFVKFTDVAVQNSSIILSKMLTEAYNKIPTHNRGQFEIDDIIAFMKLVHVPYTLSWEGGWSDNPADNGGATMRGVTLGTFKHVFDQIFSNKTPDMTVAYNAISHIPWKGDVTASKDFLYTLLSSRDIAALFIAYYFSSSSTAGLQIATYDPYLAFLIVDKTWMSGSYAWTNSVPNGNIYSAAKKFGYTGPVKKYVCESFLTWIRQLSISQRASFAAELLVNYTNHVNALAAKSASQRQFIKGWLSRIVGTSNNRHSMSTVLTKWTTLLKNESNNVG